MLFAKGCMLDRTDSDRCHICCRFRNTACVTKDDCSFDVVHSFDFSFQSLSHMSEDVFSASRVTSEIQKGITNRRRLDIFFCEHILLGEHHDEVDGPEAFLVNMPIPRLQGCCHAVVGIIFRWNETVITRDVKHVHNRVATLKYILPLGMSRAWNIMEPVSCAVKYVLGFRCENSTRGTIGP